MKSNKIIMGTRGSILAIAQAEKVKEMLYKKYEELRIEDNFREIEGFSKEKPLEINLKTIVTTGDKDFRNFSKIEGVSQKYLFVKEIEQEMLTGKIDFAVHSLKDMPQLTPDGLENVCFPLREDNRDVLISRNGEKLKELPKNSIIGTGSTRRAAELRNLLHNRQDIVIKEIRGNIHTRLKKLYEGNYNAIILAAAGLKRTGMEEKITCYFSDDEFMPAPGQGILCIQCRRSDKKIKSLLSLIDDREVRIMCQAEREFSRIFDGGCHASVGCSSKIEGENIIIKGMYSYNGNRIVKKIEGNMNNSIELAGRLAEEIKAEEKRKGSRRL